MVVQTELCRQLRNCRRAASGYSALLYVVTTSTSKQTATAIIWADPVLGRASSLQPLVAAAVCATKPPLMRERLGAILLSPP